MNFLMFILSTVFGLQPFKRTKSNSILLLDYALMIIAPVAYLICYYLVLFRENFGVYQLPECNNICRLGNILFMHLGSFLYLSIHYTSLRRGKHFFKSFQNRLEEIDLTIVRCRKLTNEKTKPAKIAYVFYLMWIFICIIFSYALYYDISAMFWRMKERFIVSVMITAFPFLTGSIVQGQFIYYVSIIIDRFDKINSLFEAINHECDRKDGSISIFDIENNIKKNKKERKESGLIVTDLQKEEEDLSSSDDIAEEETEKKSEDLITEEPSDSRTSESNLPDLFKLHNKIMELSVVTNEEFGAQCVPYMTVCFVIGIFGIFLETKVIFVVGGMSSLLDYTAQIYINWSVLMAIVAYIVLRLCCNANGKSKNSALIVHEIMQKKPAFMLGNDLYYNKMKAFTLQFLHWESFFHFNGIGLFALDYTFIFSIVSAATSYLIVLLQFDMTATLKAEGLL